jgi:hypothetical protein
VKVRSIIASIVVCVLAFSVSSREGYAATVYTYTGLPFSNSFIVNASPPAGTYTDSMMVSGSFTVASPLLNQSFPTEVLSISQSFSFSDGRTTITNLNAVLAQLFVETDGAGQIVFWTGLLTSGSNFSGPVIMGDQLAQIELATSDSQIIALHDNADLLECNQANALGHCLDIRTDIAKTRGLGTWSMTTVADSTTPLPSALSLFATGIGVIGLVARRRKRQPTAIAA